MWLKQEIQYFMTKENNIKVYCVCVFLAKTGRFSFKNKPVMTRTRVWWFSFFFFYSLSPSETSASFFLSLSHLLPICTVLCQEEDFLLSQFLSPCRLTNKICSSCHIHGKIGKSKRSEIYFLWSIIIFLALSFSFFLFSSIWLSVCLSVCLSMYLPYKVKSHNSV